MKGVPVDGLLDKVDKITGLTVRELLRQGNSVDTRISNAVNAQTTKRKIKTAKPEYKRDDRVMTLTLDYPPSTNMLYVMRPDGKRSITKEGREYKKRAALQALSQGTFLFTGEVVFEMKVFRPRLSRDLSNCVKAAEDALRGIAWHDDEQVAKQIFERFLDRENPRLEIKIYQKRLTEMSESV